MNVPRDGVCRIFFKRFPRIPSTYLCENSSKFLKKFPMNSFIISLVFSARVFKCLISSVSAEFLQELLKIHSAFYVNFFIISSGILPRFPQALHQHFPGNCFKFSGKSSVSFQDIHTAVARDFAGAPAIPSGVP